MTRIQFLLPLALLGAVACSGGDDPAIDDTAGGQTDDGGTTDDPSGFSAEIRANRPSFMPIFKIQPANNDDAEKIAMSCGGNSVCTAKLEEPGEWRLWGEATGWLITYNKVVAIAEDGEVAVVTLNEFGDYGIDVTGLVYEDEDGDQHEVETLFAQGQVVLDGLMVRKIPMLGNKFEGQVAGQPYTVSGEVAADLSSITFVSTNDETLEAETFTYKLVVE